MNAKDCLYYFPNILKGTTLTNIMDCINCVNFGSAGNRYCPEDGLIINDFKTNEKEKEMIETQCRVRIENSDMSVFVSSTDKIGVVKVQVGNFHTYVNGVDLMNAIKKCMSNE